MVSAKQCLLLILIAPTLVACTDQSASIACPPIAGNPLSVQPVPVKADLLMDATASMKGFMGTGTAFQALVADISGRLDRGMDSFRFFAISQKNNPLQRITPSDARKAIAYGNFSFGGVSTLPVMLDTAIRHASAGRLSILVTDAVYTPPWNSAKLKYQEVTDISDVFARARKAQLAVSCFAFRSAYNTIVSPYYFFVIGTPSGLTAFRKALDNSLAAIARPPAEALYQDICFIPLEQQMFYSIIPYAENTGAGEPATCPEQTDRYLLVNEIDPDLPAQYWIGLDLSGYPAFIDNDAYLKKNIQIQTQGANVSLIGEPLSAAAFIPRLSDATDKALAARCTHFIHVGVKDISGEGATVSISLRKTRPPWVAAWSHDDAANAEKIRERTFGLENIVSGMEDAYGEKTDKWFFRDLKIILTKKE